MYFNDVHILYYVFLILIGFVIGQLVDYCSKCFIKEKKIFSKETWNIYKRAMLPNYLVISAVSIIYVLLLYKFGIGKNFQQNITLIKYMILAPMLICAFYVDFKEQIIPNRLNLLILETGLIFTFIEGFQNINLAKDMILGMLAGGRNISTYYNIRSIFRRKRGNGVWRRKIYGGSWTVFWTNKHNSNISNVFPSLFDRSNYCFNKK